MANVPMGTQDTVVLDSNKFYCSNCNGTMFQISLTMDEPADINSPAVTDLTVTNAGGKGIQAIPVLCQSCGTQQYSYVRMFDVAVTNAGASTMTDMVETSANSLAGWYGIPMVGTDVEKYFVVSTNTAADPTVITWTVAPNNDSDGIWVIQNWLPVGYTAAS